jgi:D-3-phosphoglycerate dehydrogenase
MKTILNYDVHSFDPRLLALISREIQVLNIDSECENTKNVIGVICRLGTIFNAENLECYENLRFIATITTGLDHIDLDYCHKRGIRIISLKGEVEFLSEITATPELTWGLLLSLVRKIPLAHNDVISGNWQRERFYGRSLKNKTIGIIGLGRIGKIVASYAHIFGMRINVVDIVYEPLEPDLVIHRCNLEELVKTSDVITIHVPYDEQTKNLLNRNILSKLKKNSIIINTSRGGILDEVALLEYLLSGAIGGAALDVLSFETNKNNIKIKNDLIKYATENDNLIITPHIGGSTYEAMQLTSEFIAKKVIYFLKNDNNI